MTKTESKLIPLYLIDRSGAELDDHCGQAFWWQRKEGGKGLVPKTMAEALAVGSEVHADMEVLATMDLDLTHINRFVNGIMETFPDLSLMTRPEKEILFRRFGWFVAWALFIEPKIRLKYETIAVEQDLILDRTPLWVPVKPDRLLRDRSSKQLVYFEYKSTLTASQKWLLSWHFAIQLHSSLAAIMEETQEEVKFAQVVGLLKGSRSLSDGRLLHPYVWGWYNEKTGKWTNKYEDARTADWAPRPVWEYPGGIVEWVSWCGQETAIAQFPFTAPVFYNGRILNNWILRQTHRRREVSSVETDCVTDLNKRAIYFPMRTKQCRPAFGDPCPYTRLCWNASSNYDAQKDPGFMVREPHHEIDTIEVI